MRRVKLCVAQVRPVKGDIARNIATHKKFINLAVSHGAGMVVFPELSLTGYEPRLAKALATDQDDGRFDDFQKISDSREITIGVGVPTKNEAGICISMVLFQPHAARQTYSKKYLHPDEEAFFVSGESFTGLEVKGTRIAPAICYELSVQEHVENAFRRGADVYVASVAKFVNGVDKAIARLSEIAGRYAMTVLMCNCVGQADGQACGGKTSIWNNKGVLIGQLNQKDEGILIIDTNTQERVA